MVKYFLAYAEEDGELAESIAGELGEAGLEDAAEGCDSDEEALKAADCLILLVTSQKQTTLPEIRRRWEFFDGEMRWKRKTRGEILLLAASDEAISGLPLRLKKCGYYYVNEVADAARYLEETYGVTEEPEEKDEQAENGIKHGFPEVKEIKYNPPEEKIEAPKYTVKVPGIDPFDGKPAVREKPSGACRDDHVFEDDFGIPEKNAPSKKKVSAVGCFAAIFAIIVFVIVISTLFAAISENGGCSCALESTFGGVFASPFDSALAFPRFANALQTFPLVI